MAPPRPLVLTADADPAARIDALQQVLGPRATVAPLPKDAAERAQRLQEAQVLVVARWGLEKADLGHLANLRLVQSVWAGIDRIPVQDVASRWPKVLFATGSGPNAAQTAESAVALYLDCAKRVSRRDRALRGGQWLQELPGRRIHGSRVAVVGYGAVGRTVARALDGLGAEVLAVTRDGRSDDGRTATTIAGLRAQLGAVAGVVLALPLTRETRGLVDASWLASMPADGILVNVARGALVDEDALYAHLSAHADFYAGLDVWWDYPRKNEAFRPRRDFGALDNVVMTPHSAFHVPGTRDEMLQGAAENVARFLDGDPVQHRIDPADY